MKGRVIRQSGWVGRAGHLVGGIVFHSRFVDNYNVIPGEEICATGHDIRIDQPWYKAPLCTMTPGTYGQ